MVDGTASNKAGDLRRGPRCQDREGGVAFGRRWRRHRLRPDLEHLYIALDGYGVQGYSMSTGLKVFDSGQLPSGTNDADGIAIGSGDLRNELFVNTNQGTIVEVSITSPSTHTVIASGGSRGDFATVDPNNGTFLLSQTDRVVRLIPAAWERLQGGSRDHDVRQRGRREPDRPGVRRHDTRGQWRQRHHGLRRRDREHHRRKTRGPGEHDRGEQGQRRRDRRSGNREQRRSGEFDRDGWFRNPRRGQPRRRSLARLGRLV